MPLHVRTWFQTLGLVAIPRLVHRWPEVNILWVPHRIAGKLLVELLNEPRLALTRITQNHADPRLLVLHNTFELLAQPLKFFCTANKFTHQSILLESSI